MVAVPAAGTGSDATSTPRMFLLGSIVALSDATVHWLTARPAHVYSLHSPHESFDGGELINLLWRPLATGRVS